MADLTVTAANVLPSTGARKKSCTFGETVTAGQALYRNKTDGRFYKADANASIDTAQLAGIAAEGGSAGQPGTYWYAGDIFIGATTASGALYVLSGTAGGIAPASTDLLSAMYTSIVGVGKTGNVIGLVTYASRALVP